jgi:cytochrome c peroxidase|tara:strand:- start:5935 stop:7053 length:1119 start_codon:yes stop_codon:yes gene_type:complete
MVAVATLSAAEPPVYETLEQLGEGLFFDVNLSQRRSQSCATCHSPETAFTDTRSNSVGGAVSLGDDGMSLGDRNTPTLGYISLSPDFHINRAGDYRGGFFLDGRAANLTAQAGRPIFNPAEMALPDTASLRARIMENPRYLASMKRLFGDSVFTDSDRVQQAVAQSIAAFERTARFAPFDSKYDRYLRGEYQMTRREEQGRVVFFSELLNCNGCHLLDQPQRETFTDNRYHNVGTPVNELLLEHMGTSAGQPDLGLANNPAVTDGAQRGKFRTPTLRNVAVTGPYMHNGVFDDLRTVLLFYNTYFVGGTSNPESGAAWSAPEVGENIDQALLSKGQPMDTARIDAVLAFLHTLTDRRYEHLLFADSRSSDSR